MKAGYWEKKPIIESSCPASSTFCRGDIYQQKLMPYNK